MKKILSILMSFCIVFSLISCAKQNIPENNKTNEKLISKENLEKIYNELPENIKKEIDFNYDNIDVSNVILEKDMGFISDNTYLGKEVYKVNFVIRDKNIQPNERIVFVTTEEFNYIGEGYID